MNSLQKIAINLFSHIEEVKHKIKILKMKNLKSIQRFQNILIFIY